MTAHSYECLLVAANLAVFHKSWGFTIKILQWKKFLEGHHFITSNSIGSFEVDTKKIGLHAFINGTKSTKNRAKIHMIRIGVLDDNSPRKIEMQKYRSHGRMIITPPRLNGLRIKRQSFRYLTEHFKWNYILEDDADEDLKDEDDGEDDKDDSDVDNGDSTTSSPATSNKKRKYNAVMVVCPATDKSCCGNVSMDKRYPYLSRALGGEDGFDPTNPSVKRSMCSLMTELNKLLSTEYLLDINGISNNKISYVRVPRTQSDRSFHN
jgi:hypothetical protein